MATKTGGKTNKKNKQPTNAAPVDAAGAPVGAQSAVESGRDWKNKTTSSIDPAVEGSFDIWLTEFKAQCEQHPPRKGYDQHWNGIGFIHMGPTTRLNPQGMARMLTVLFDGLATQALAGSAEAREMYAATLKFGRNHISSLEKKIAEGQIAAAQEIIKAAGGKVTLPVA